MSVIRSAILLRRIRDSLIWLFPLIAIGVVFFLLMTLSPLYADDFNDVFLQDSKCRICSAREFFANIGWHYYHKSGRFLPILFDQTFGVLCGKTVFNILNSVIFVTFLLLLAKQTGNSSNIGLTSVLLFSLLPGFDLAILWMAGACNYLWPAVLLLLFIKTMESERKLALFPCFVFGLICGWTNEAMVIGLMAGYLVHYSVHKKALNTQRTVLLSGFCLGVLLLALAPSSIHRYMEGAGSSLSFGSLPRRLLSSFAAMKNLRILPLFLVVAIIGLCRKKGTRNFLKHNLFLIVAVCVSFLFLVATNHTSDHSRFGIELFSLILLLRLVTPVLSTGIRGPLLSLACYLVTLIILCPTIYYSILNNQEYRRCAAQINQTQTGIIETSEPAIPTFFDRLVLRFMPSETNDNYHGFLGEEWIDKYYGKGALIFLPRRFLTSALQNPSSFQDFDLSTDLPFYVKSATPNIPINGIRLCLSPAEPQAVPFYFRPFMDYFERWTVQEVNVDKWRVVSLPQGQTYLFVKKNPLVSDRVSFIDIL